MKTENSVLNIILFFIIALGWSDGIWILLNPIVQKNLGITFDPMWAWLGLIGPGLAAILVSLKKDGLSGLSGLFKPLVKWRVSVIYYLFVYVGVFSFYTIASWLSKLIFDEQETESLSWLLVNVKTPFFNLHGICGIIEITVIYLFCEELGWRGYALPAINRYFSGLTAAIIIGVIWTLWHVPLIYLYGSSLNFDSTFVYFLHIECMSIFYAWLFFKTNKSLLLVGLFHGTTDGMGAFFPITHSVIGQGSNLPTVILEIFIALLMSPYLWKVKPLNAKGA